MNGFEILSHYVSQAMRQLIDPYFYLFTSWLLFWVFAVAGVAKLQDLPGTAQAITNFGITRTSRHSVAALLGIGELVLATGLVLVPMRQYAIVGASMLLALFSVLLGRSLARRERFNCSCFGKESAPISYRTLVRTGALAVLSVLAAATHSAGAFRVQEEALASVLGLASVGTFALFGLMKTLTGDSLAQAGGRP